MIETEEMYNKLSAMHEEERIEVLDPICYSVHGKVKLHGGIEVLANRVFALAVLELYHQWQQEIYFRD